MAAILFDSAPILLSPWMNDFNAKLASSQMRERPRMNESDWIRLKYGESSSRSFLVYLAFLLDHCHAEIFIREAVMKSYLSSMVAVLLSFLVAVPALAQPGPGWGDGYGWGPGRGMGRGMMGHQVAPDVPGKLPAPKNQEWTQKLQAVLNLERLSQAQYTADAEKFSAHMPYAMVIPQEIDHIRTIERLFSAYGLPAASKQMDITETQTLTQALELCVELERDLITRYEWLVQHAEEHQSAAVLNELLFQTRHHMIMFQRALRMGGGMGPMGGRMGPGMMR